MAMLIKVQGAERDSEGNIVGICWRDSARTKRRVSVTQAIREVEEKIATYCININGQQRNLLGKNGHLTAALDGEETDIIEKLPNCQDV